MTPNIIKFGGSVITNRTATDFFAAPTANRLSKELFPFYKNSILIHGTGQVGKPPAIKYGYVDTGVIGPKDRLVALKIKADLRRLNQQMVQTLLMASIPAIPFDIIHFYKGHQGQWNERSLEKILMHLLENGLLPVFHGDLLPLPDGSFQVFSSDRIALELARMLRPQNVVLLTNVDGVFSHLKDGRLIEILTPNELAHFEMSKQDEADVSGGMSQKAKLALEIARYCQKCFIGNGLSEGLLSKFLQGEETRGTLLKPDC